MRSTAAVPSPSWSFDASSVGVVYSGGALTFAELPCTSIGAASSDGTLNRSSSASASDSCPAMAQPGAQELCH
ncbi:hypothetical protein GUJ93_ZPchr0013g35389, partial [Zizania palustris]